MIADLRLPIVDCPRNETRKSKSETREPAADFPVSSFQFLLIAETARWVYGLPQRGGDGENPTPPNRLDHGSGIGFKGARAYNRGMDPVVAKFRTFREAEAATRDYYRRLSSAERLEILFQLRALAHKEGDAASGRLAHVYRIAQLKRG
jgi:hypothetical protein